jgi:hypothetical protein
MTNWWPRLHEGAMVRFRHGRAARRAELMSEPSRTREMFVIWWDDVPHVALIRFEDIVWVYRS